MVSICREEGIFMKTLAYLLSALGLIAMILASLTKGEKMKRILFLVFCRNALVATSYLLYGKGINGAAACYLAALQSIINYTFESKGKDVPKWLICIYAIAIIVLNIWVAGGVTALGLLVIVASFTFLMCIGQKNGAKYRIWVSVNISLWCLYDILSGSYSALVSHIPLLIFNFAGMFIYDRKKK